MSPRRLPARREPFEVTESELSAEANAILAYARRWGNPFTRAEIVAIAPGAAWDDLSRWPKTIAKRDPIRELVKAKMIEQCGEGETLIPPKRRGQATIKGTYYLYRLTDRHAVPSLAELLDMLIGATSAIGGTEGERFNEIRTEILDRFGAPR